MVSPHAKRVIKNTITADKIIFKKDGTVEALRSYFYRMGDDQHKMAQRIKDKLKEKGLNITIVQVWDNWKPFRGGRSLRASSHWGVIFRVDNDSSLIKKKRKSG